MTVAVEFDHVSKRFILEKSRSQSFQEVMVNLFKRERRESQAFWALNDVTFSLEKGKTVGFIGANGAGKSTALKMISSIIEPTSGEVRSYGRVGALLELGAGFHPDLTGRENIFLNGAILGLSRDEIRGKVDDIISFAELERFIDVPVKHYSSGMYVRLGFSVAIHTEPEILLVDEVLSVGDANFQHKCMEQIAQLRNSGVTIVLVSHSLETIQSFCEHVIWFDKGKVMGVGNATDVAMAYTSHIAQKYSADADDKDIPAELKGRRWGTGKLKVVGVELQNGQGETTATFATGESMDIVLKYQVQERIEHPVFGLAIHHQNGVHICGPNTGFSELEIPFVEGEGAIVYHIPSLPLLSGAYKISVAAHDYADMEMYDYHDRIYPFRIYMGGTRERYGLMTLNGSWSVLEDVPGEK